MTATACRTGHLARRNAALKAETTARVLKVYEDQPGVWLGSSKVAELGGLSRITVGKRAADLAAEGRLEHSGRAGAHSLYRAPAEPGTVVPLGAPQRRPAKSRSADRPAGGDQYDGRSLDDLLLMCRERGVLLTASEETNGDAMRRLLREWAAGADNPGLHAEGTQARNTLTKKVKLSDEDLRRERIEQQILEACVDAPMKPRGVAVPLMRNGQEIRGIMMELCHRGLLASRDGFSTFRTVRRAA